MGVILAQAREKLLTAKDAKVRAKDAKNDEERSKSAEASLGEGNPVYISVLEIFGLEYL